MAATTYKGFTIETEKKLDGTFTVYWEEITGHTKRHSNDHESAGAALAHARDRIDQYHKELDTAQHHVAGMTRPKHYYTHQ